MGYLVIVYDPTHLVPAPEPRLAKQKHIYNAYTKTKCPKCLPNAYNKMRNYTTNATNMK